MGWIIRGLLFLSSLIAGLFLAQDDANFEVFSFGIALILFAAGMACYAFWPQIKRLVRGWTRPDTDA